MKSTVAHASPVGAALCLLSAVCFGAMGVFGKFAYTVGVGQEALLLVRFALAACLLWALLVLRPDLRRLPRGSARTPTRLSPVTLLVVAVGLGAVGYAAQAAFFFAALARLNASLVTLLFYTYPLLVSLSAVALGRDRLTRTRSAALAAATGGAVLVLMGAGGVRFDGGGALLALGAAVTYTVYILVADVVVHHVPPVLLAAIVMTGAACTTAARALLSGNVDLSFGLIGWAWVTAIAVVSTVVAMLAFFAGLNRTGASTAAILSTLEPVVTTALAGLLLGEFLTALQLAGGVLVLLAVVAVQWTARPSSTRGLRSRRRDASTIEWAPSSAEVGHVAGSDSVVRGVDRLAGR